MIAFDGMQPTLRQVPPSPPSAALLDQHDIEAELARPDRRDIAAGPAADDEHLGSDLGHLSLYENRRRRFEQALDALDEARRNIAVDDAVIEGGRQIHHGARHELRALPHRAHDLLVDADDRDLRPVDHRRGDDTAERAQAGDGDGRAGQLGAASPCPRARPRQGAAPRRRSPTDRAPRMADHGHHESRPASAWRCRYARRHAGQGLRSSS